MMYGLISTYRAGYDRAAAGLPPLRHDAGKAGPWANGDGPHGPNRSHVGAALASALAEAGLVEPAADHMGGTPFIDLAILKAISERPSLPSQIGRLIREYLGSLDHVASPLVPTLVLVNGTTEISTWRHDVGRLSGGSMQG